jgi:outer membrane protein TolC
MSKHLPQRRRYRWFLWGGLALPVFLAHSPEGLTEEGPPLAPQQVIIIPAQAPAQETTPAPVPQETGKLDLPTCRRIGLEKQPALAAARATLAAAQARQQSLEQMHLAGIIRHDLAIRRQQADRGVQVAQAQLTQAEFETIYAVTRTYVGVLYAQAQLRVADRVLSNTPEGLPFLRDLAENIYKNRTRPDVKAWNVDQIEVYISVARGRKQEALEGLERAKAGLREAMGVDPNFPIDLSDQKMPRLDVPVSLDVVTALAFERRGEISQAALAEEIVCLEVKAQGTSHHPKLETFAAGSDIHAQPAPQGVRNGEYRPGAINIEMPTEMVGSKSNRVEQARALHARAAAVNEKTRGLVALEVKSAFLKWEETRNQSKEYGEARDKARHVYDTLRGERGFDPKDKAGGKPDLGDLLNAAVQASQTEVQANQAQYLHLLSLAALERVTAGGFNPGFDTLAPVPAETGNNKK